MPDEAAPRQEFASDDLTVRMDETTSAELTAVDSLIERVMETIREMGCADGKEHDVELALREALVNAVVHGCGGDASKEVGVSVACDESRGMLIIVRNPGPGFDPAAIPSPIQGQRVFSAHGRGIFLINQLMDEVRFEKGGTEIHMRTG